MKKYFAKGNFGLSLISNILSACVAALVSFVIAKQIVETAGSVAYQFYPIATNFANYFTIIFIAINSMSARFITFSLVNEDEAKAKEYYVSVFFSDVFLSLIISIVVFFFIQNMNSILDIPSSIYPQIRQLFILVLLSSIINGCTSVFSVSTFAKNRMDLYARNNIITELFKLVLFLSFLWTSTITIVHYGVVLLVASVMMFLLNYVTTRHLLPDFHMDFSLYSFASVKEILSSGFLIMVNRTGVLLINNAQLIIANMVLGANASAPLSLVQSLYSLGTLVCYSVERTVLPMVVHIIAEQDEQYTQKMKMIQLIYLFLTVIPCTLLMGFGKQFYQLWLPKENASLLYLLSYFNILQLLITYAFSIYNAMVTAFNKVKVPSLTMLGFGMVSILLSYLLVSKTSLGMIGMLISNNIAYFIFYAIFLPSYANHESKSFMSQQKNIPSLSFVGSVLGVILINTLLGRMIPSHHFISLFLVGVVIIVVEVIVLSLSHKVTFQSLKEFVLLHQSK